MCIVESLVKTIEGDVFLFRSEPTLRRNMQSSWNSGAISGRASFKKVIQNYKIPKYKTQTTKKYKIQKDKAIHCYLWKAALFTKNLQLSGWLTCDDVKPFWSICFSLILGVCTISGPWTGNTKEQTVCSKCRENQLFWEWAGMSSRARLAWSEGVATAAGSLSFSSLAAAQPKNAKNLKRWWKRARGNNPTQNVKGKLRMWIKSLWWGFAPYLWIAQKIILEGLFNEGFRSCRVVLEVSPVVLHLGRMLPIL